LDVTAESDLVSDDQTVLNEVVELLVEPFWGDIEVQWVDAGLDEMNVVLAPSVVVAVGPETHECPLEFGRDDGHRFADADVRVHGPDSCHQFVPF
jgi:hypothetical protein